MIGRSRPVLFVVVSTLILTAVLIALAGAVTVRRVRRDLVFGLEELDVLLADGETREAAAMVPWLADRARTAGDALRVLKRAYLLFKRTGDARPMHRAAARLTGEFPAHSTIRSLAVYAAVHAGHAAEALSVARAGLGSREATVYAWALLHGSPTQGVAVEDSGPSGDGAFLLARLGPQNTAEEYERAWELTGDERYAVNAVLLRLLDGREDAVELGQAAGLGFHRPRLMAGLYVDRGRFAEAVDVLEKAAATHSATATDLDIALRLADAHMYGGNHQAARSIYERVLDRAPHEIAYVNLALLEDDRADAHLARGRERLPESWEIARAYAVSASPADRHGLLDSWFGTAYEGEAKLLALVTDPEPDRRGYEADLWMLLERHPGEAVYRYAAWYLAARSRVRDLSLLLDRASGTAGVSPESAWIHFYRGIVAAHENRWPESGERFVASFVRSPGWQAAHNAAIALYRTGDEKAAEVRLRNALLLARHGTGHERIRVFLLAALVERRGDERRRLIQEALSIDPSSPEALLLRARLENGRAR